MIQKKHQKIISMLTSIIIIGSLLTGCSSSRPVTKNVTLAAQQQKQQKIDAEKKANEDAVVNAKKETELKAQLAAEEEAKAQADEKAKIESDAEAKTRQDTEAKVQADAQLKAEQEATTIANNKIVEEKPDSKQTNGTVMVWLSETGTKYHSINNCGRMNPDKATQVTLEEAKNSYGPCSKCDPPQ